MATTTKARRDSFLKTAIGKWFNPDHAYGFQCKDLIDAYGAYLFGLASSLWYKVVPPGNARYLYDRASTAYWRKIKNNPRDRNLLPVKGDVIVWPAGAWNYYYGHTAIVESADVNGVTVIQMDGITQTAAHRKRYSWSRLPIGWLRPNYTATPKPKPKPVKKIKRGSTVRPIRAVSYSGVKLAPFVTKRNYKVIELKGSRAVLGSGLNTAFKTSNLKLIK